MKIVPTPTTLLKMEGWCASAGGLEVSGLATVDFDIENRNFLLTDAFLLDVGSSVYTEISTHKILELHASGIAPEKLKCWLHRHPIGNGIPGDHNWSATDVHTATQEPLGSLPELVKWSLAVVRTPLGWVGRLDDHGSKTVYHLPVEQVLTPQEYASALAPVRVPAPPRQQALTSYWTPAPRLDLRSYGLNADVIEEVRALLRAGSPEEVADLYDLTIYELHELGLISFDELQEAYARYTWDR
nr:hypothetical protein [Anaerolineae bacterium]